ncbi:cysteinyl leukotriene receptor 2 [Xenopus laevis]|uniref:Cysteinyl leukotriene receptor 2 n=2 Tax=Xenopus laevis TaxID=8355 RepID=A0A1L8GAL8_XENLA|nr:cysteinyl leukotriene receptor 2 [Xenopus laevis]OCT80883.1 hypothetical protein XELAEV_18027695mg [Xenopus laevis]
MADVQPPSGNESLQCKPDESYKYHVYTAVYSVVFIFGLIFNIAALYVFCFVCKKKGNATICLLNLAAADLTFICFLPLRISYYRNNATWIFGDALCRITTYSFYFSMYASILLLACLSGLRYSAVVFPGSISVKTTIKLCTCVWLFSGASTSPFFLSGTQIRENATRCFEPSGQFSWTRVMYMNYFALICGFSIPFLVTVIFNGLLIRHIKQIPTEKKKIRKLSIMIVLVLSVFSFCFLPYHIQRTMHLYYLVHHPNICSLHAILQRSVVATLCLAVLNSCLDPLLYVFVGHGFKPWLELICKSKTKLYLIPSSTDIGDQQLMEVQMEAMDLGHE